MPKLKIFRTRYRIVQQDDGWYTAEFRNWDQFFWRECGGVNIRSTIEESRNVCEWHERLYNAPAPAPNIIEHYTPKGTP